MFLNIYDFKKGYKTLAFIIAQNLYANTANLECLLMQFRLDI